MNDTSDLEREIYMAHQKKFEGKEKKSPGFTKLISLYTMRFKDPQVENLYLRSQLKYRSVVYRICTLIAFIAAASYYAWSMAIKPQNFRDLCLPENLAKSSYPCRVYSRTWDLLSFLIATCFPGFMLLALTFKSKAMVKWSEHLCNITILSWGIGNFCLAEFGNGPQEPYRIALPLIIFIFTAHFVLRCCFLSTFIHTIIFLSIFCGTQLAQLDIKPGNEVVFSIIYFLLSGILLSAISLNQEYSLRSQFWENLKAERLTNELSGKLEFLQKKYLNVGLTDLQSPLEKATNLLKFLLVESDPSTIQFNLVENIIELVSSPNIMVPDIKQVAKEKKIDIDTEVSNF